jgi:hypothetical protein
MKRLTSILATSAAAGVLAISALAVTAGGASARDWDDYHRHNVVRCDRDGDSCVVYRCDGDGDSCRRIRSFHRDTHAYWLRGYGYHRDYRGVDEGRWTWYGQSHLRCDPDGDRCWRVRN